MSTRRRPWVAALLSLALPGLGHLYAGNPGGALAAYGLSLAALLAMVVAWLSLPGPPFNLLVATLALLLIFVGIPLHAALRAQQAQPGYVLRPYNRWYVYLVLVLIVNMVAAPQLHDYLKSKVLEPFRIPSDSMAPTLLVGDFVYLTKSAAARRDVRLGAVVVFESVEEPGLEVTKRVSGLLGDTIAMKVGLLYRNGQPLKEPYAIHQETTRSEDPVQRAKMRSWQLSHLALADGADYAPDLQDWGPLVVPPDSFFALGDNRDASYDSRYYGFVPMDRVLGRPRVIYLSYDARSPDILHRIRWGRLGQVRH